MAPITINCVGVRRVSEAKCDAYCSHQSERRFTPELPLQMVPSSHSITSSASASRVVRTLRPMPLLGGRLILEDQAEQEMHVAAVSSAFRRLGSIGSPHLAQVPYVPSDIRFRAASILWISVVSVFSITSSAS